MISRIESREYSNFSSTTRFLKIFLLLFFCGLGAASHSFASAQSKHNIWVMGAPGAGKSALISAAITKLATPEIFAKLGNLNPDRLDEFGEQVAEDRDFFETLGKGILSRPSLAIGNIEGSGGHNPSNFSFKLKFSPIEISTDTHSSILHSTRYLNQYTHVHSGCSFIDTPGIKSGNAYQVADAMNFGALTSKGGLQGSVNQIVALLQVNRQMLEEIQQEATTSSSWVGYFSQGLRKTLYYNDFERQIANIVNTVGGTVNLKQHGAPIQLVLVPSQEMLADFEGIKSLNDTLSLDASLKVNLANKISKLGLPVEGNQLITQLVNWTSIYESSLDLRDPKFSYYAERIESILDKIFKNKKLGLKFEIGKKLEKSQKAIAASDGNLVSELPEKTKQFYQEASELRSSLEIVGQSLKQDLEEVEGLQTRDIKLTKEKSRLPGLSILSSSDMKGKTHSSSVNFRFASVSQFRDAVYHADFLFFGKNSEGQFGIFFDLDTFPKSITGDLPPIPKRIDRSIKRIGLAEALVHSFEYVDPKNGADKKTVRFELLSKDIKTIEKTDLLSGILADDFNGYVSIHARGNGNDLYSYGTAREFPVDVYSVQDDAELEYKKLDRGLVEKAIGDIQLKKMAVDANLDKFEESKESFRAVSRQKDVIFSDFNSYVAGLKRGGVPNVDAYLKLVANENGGVKEEFDKFSNAPVVNQLNNSFENLIILKTELEHKVKSLDKRFDPILPESKTSELETMVYKSHDEMPKHLLSERTKEAISLIFDAFEDGVLSSRVENGEFIYSSTSAEVLAALVNTIYLPRYLKGAKIIANEGGKLDFRCENNFELGESNDDRWQIPMDQEGLTTNINIAVFGPRGSGKTTFLNTANHFASTLDKGVAKAIDETHGMGYPGLPLSAWANRGFNHSWTHGYYGNDEFTIGSLRAQLPALASDSMEFVSLCKDPTCASVNVHEHKFLRPNPVQKGSTEANGEVLDSINTVKVGMIPHYHLKALDVRGFIPDDNVFGKKDTEKSNPLLRAMMQNKDFESLDGLVLVLNAQKILNDDQHSSYKRSTENQLLAINEIRKNSETGDVSPLHVVFTHFLDLVKNGEKIEKSSSEGESNHLSHLRNQLHAHLRELLGTGKENINVYFIDQEYLWSDSKSLANKNRFIHYKTTAHEVVRLFENVNKKAWKMELDDFRENFANALEQNRVMLKYSSGDLDSAVSVYRKTEGEQGDFSVDGQAIDPYDRENINEKQAAALQFVQMGLDDQKHIQVQERGSASMHYFLREDNPEMVWWNHHKGPNRTAGREKLADLVVDQIRDLANIDGIDGSVTDRDLFVVRSLGKLGKLKGQYRWYRAHKKYDITSCTLIHKILWKLEKSGLVSNELKSRFKQAKQVATKYRGTQDDLKEKTANEPDYGGDLHLVAVFARSFDKETNEPKIEMVYIDVKNASELNGEVDISEWLF